MKIFVVDDERIIRVSVADELRDHGYTVYEFAEPTAALAGMREIDVEVIITDMKMPGMDGTELITRALQMKPDLTIVVMTAYGTVQNAVDAMRLGAYNYINKPFEVSELVIMLRGIKEFRENKKDLRNLGKRKRDDYDFSAFVADSEEITRMFDLVKLVVEEDTSVLIQGETGTGKELLTNIIHYNSNRNGKPLIKVSCALLSKDIFESELFGHEKGAFTGAEKTRIGRFEMANEGTLYLDDIDDMPLDLQVKLLRVLEEGEIERVGGNETIAVDIRLIASTKYDLKKLAAEGKFREDLFYRLNVFPITIPPLRERKKDIRFLALYFARLFSNKPGIRIEKEVFDALGNYPFPGNTRELRNLVERLVLLSKKEDIAITHLPIEITNPATQTIYASLGQKPLSDILSEIEANSIRIALEKSSNKQSQAAKMLGMPLSTLRDKMGKHGIN